MCMNGAIENVSALAGKVHALDGVYVVPSTNMIAQRTQNGNRPSLLVLLRYPCVPSVPNDSILCERMSASPDDAAY